MKVKDYNEFEHQEAQGPFIDRIVNDAGQTLEIVWISESVGFVLSTSK